MPTTTPTGPSRAETLRTFYEHVLSVSRRLASTSDLHEVLGLIIDTLRDSLHADRVSVFQYDKARHELFATKSHGLSQDLRLPADKGIIGEAAKCRAIVNIPDAYADPRFNQAVDKATGYTTRCMLTIPLLDFEGQLVGVAQLLNKSTEHGGVFTAEDEELAMHLADQAAVALKRAALIEARRIKEKLEADLDVARKIQQASLAKKLPVLPGYDVAGHFQPAEETAGDAYDIIDLRADDLPAGADATGGTGGGGRAGEAWAREADALVFMADATGHGIGPALSVAQVLAMVRMGCRLGATLECIARQVNHQLCRDLPMGRFVTSFLGLLNIHTHELSYFSAGQAPILFIRANPALGEPAYDSMNSNAMPFGIDDEFFAERMPPFVFKPDDCFVQLSDGYFEATAGGDEQFGVERVVEAVRASQRKSAAEILGAIREALAAFVRGHPADDDQTAIIIKRAS